MNRWRLVVLAAALTLTAGTLRAGLPEREPLRDWTTVKGQKFRAAIVKVEGATVLFRGVNGRRTPVALDRLSEADRQYLAKWQEQQPLQIEMPDDVSAEPADLEAEVVSEDERKREFIYRTGHFEFISQGKLTQRLLREVTGNFEATHALLSALPWGIDPQPPAGDRFEAKLLRTSTDYEAAGGMKNSGGVFLRKENVFLVPFSSIGLKVVGKSYAKDRDFDTHTLVHELTHQMMGAWLGFLPQWIIEGTAEYTASLPLRHGHFRVSAAKSGLRDYLEKMEEGRGIPRPYPLEKLFPMTNAQWNQILTEDPSMARRLYYTSYLLVYYFMNLDGEGEGQLLVRYFHKVGEVRREVVDYRRAVEEFKKQPGVEKLEDGGYRWPGDLVPPQVPEVLASEEARDAFQRESLDILLNGRTLPQLTEEIRSAFAKTGIRL